MVGRYVLLDQLGAGAMGVVYSAYDPELDRKLALKLLHPRSSSRENKATRNRLRREAQALARLTHPNVVAVHDVGTHGGRVFVAMEFIAGQTLRQWLRRMSDLPRSVDEVIEVFVAAGQGLAAAHRAGLVHRDFKPENVLIGFDGLVRVVDFGLARRSSEEELGEDSIDTSGTLTMDDVAYESIASTASRSLELSLTGTGRAMGTPAYMAPEQHLGETATIRSDQFAFCVALWEALYDQRPFPGTDLPSLTMAVTTGRMREPPTDGPHANRVPSHIHRAMVRGLSVDPEDRFVKIDDLLSALTHDPNQRRRRLGRILSINVVGASIVFGAGMWAAGFFDTPVSESSSTCAADSMLAQVWNDERRTAIRTRFDELDAPFAEFSGRELLRRLDAYAAQWTAAWTEACEAEQALGSSAELEAQRDCLDQHRRELAVFTEALVSTDAEDFATKAEHAVAAAESLPHLRICRDPSRIGVDTERSAAERKRVAALELRLAEAHATGILGDPAAGLSETLAVLDEARELDSPRTSIRARLVAADFQHDADNADEAFAQLVEAYALAETHGEDWLRAEAALQLVSVTGFDLQRATESAAWEKVSGSLLTRIGDPADLRGLWHKQVGSARLRQSELDEAEAEFERALALLEQAYGPHAREIEPVLQRLGSVARERGDYDRALEVHQRLLERRQAAYGPDHPSVASIYGALGNDAFFRADYKLAREHYEQALRIVAGAYGENSPAYLRKLSNYAAVLERLGELAEAEAIHRRLLETNIERYGERDVRITTSLENLGLVLLSSFELDQASELFRRSLAIRVEHHGDNHTATASSKLNLGFALHHQGRQGEARELFEQTLATWRDKLGDDHPDLALVYDNLAAVDLEQGRLADAEANFHRAMALTEAALGEDSADLGYSLTGLARVALARGQFEQAITYAERALNVREGTWLPAGDLGKTQLTLSRALHARGDEADHSRIRDLALLAREDIRSSGNQAQLDEAHAWLEQLE